eukprot:Rmarinus@m.3174
MELPPNLKAVQKYLQRAKEVEQHYPVIAYYCTQFAMEKALEIRNPSNKDETAFLMHTMDELEKSKKELEMPSKEEGKKLLENFALNIFARTDKEDRSGKITKKTARNFFVASCFMEACAQFGPLSPEIEERLKYARIKASYISKCLGTGVVPKPGPPGEGSETMSEPDTQGTSSEAGACGPSEEPSSTNARSHPHSAPLPPQSAPGPSSSPPAQPHATQPHSAQPPHTPHHAPSMPQPSPQHTPSPSYSFPAPHPPEASHVPSRHSPNPSMYPPSGPAHAPAFTPSPAPAMAPAPAPAPALTSPSPHPPAPTPAPAPAPAVGAQYQSFPTAPRSNLGFHDVSEAQKHAKWAVSALQMDDNRTAVKELLNALRILTKG